MLWGWLINRKRYSWRDVAIATSITMGCFVFFMTGNVSSRIAKGNTSVYGVLLMMGYLGFDGFTSTFQVGRPVIQLSLLDHAGAGAGAGWHT